MYTTAEHEEFPKLAIIVEPTVTFENFSSASAEYAENSTNKDAIQSPFDCSAAEITSKSLPKENWTSIGSVKSEFGVDAAKRGRPKATAFTTRDDLEIEKHDTLPQAGRENDLEMVSPPLVTTVT